MRRPVLICCLFLTMFARPAAAEEPSFNDRRLSEWASMLKDDPLPRKRRAAVVALGTLAGSHRDAAAPALIALGKAVQADASPQVRAQAAQAIGQMRAEDAALAAGDLAASVRQERDPAVRREVAVALGRLGKLAKVAAGPLTDALKDPDPGVLAAVAEALGRLGGEAAAAAPELVKLAGHATPAVRQAAVFALGRVEAEDKAAAGQALIKVFQGKPSAELRREVVTSFGLLGEVAAEVPGLIAPGLSDADAEYRLLVAQTLGRFGAVAKGAVAEVAAKLGQDPDKGVRQTLARTLCRVLGADAPSQIPLLTERLKLDTDFEVRVAIAEELGALGAAGKSAVPALKAAQRDPQVAVREAATVALRQIERPTPPPKK